MELQLVCAQKWVSERNGLSRPAPFHRGSSGAVHFTSSPAVGFHLCEDVLGQRVAGFSWENVKTPLTRVVSLLQGRQLSP